MLPHTSYYTGRVTRWPAGLFGCCMPWAFLIVLGFLALPLVIIFWPLLVFHGGVAWLAEGVWASLFSVGFLWLGKPRIKRHGQHRATPAQQPGPRDWDPPVHYF